MPEPEEPHLGIIRVSASLMQTWNFQIDEADTQGKLHALGIFERLEKKLLLPASYTVKGLFYRHFSHTWDVLVESAELPACLPYCDIPIIVPTYSLVERIARLSKLEISVPAYTRTVPDRGVESLE